MYKLYCSECEHRFSITDDTLKNFIEDENARIECPECHSTEVNILGVDGQRTGY